MKVIFLPLVLLCVSCTQASNSLNNELMKKFEVNGHYANHCGGVDVPVCKYFVKGVQKDRTREYQMRSLRYIFDMLGKN